jgi:hypothetical protein
MVSLTDIAPSTRTVGVDGQSVNVMGISALGVAALLREFPSLKGAFTGAKLDFDLGAVLTFGPDVVAAIIAAGCGSPGDPKAIAAASNLPVQKQAEFIDAILELTMPDGVGPFAVALESIMGRLDFGDRGKAPGSNSPSQSKP